MMSSSRRVLFVEREESLQRLIAHVLGRIGIEADSAKDGPAAIKLLARERYCVVLLDVLDAAEACYEVIRAMKLIPLKDRPVVIAASDPEPHPKLDPDIVSLVIRKPYDVEAVADVVTACVGGHALRMAEDPKQKERSS